MTAAPIQKTDTYVKSYSSISPVDTSLTACPSISQPLMTYTHPERAVYLLGAEDFGLPEDVIASCDDVIQLPGD